MNRLGSRFKLRQMDPRHCTQAWVFLILNLIYCRMVCKLCWFRCLRSAIWSKRMKLRRPRILRLVELAGHCPQLKSPNPFPPSGWSGWNESEFISRIREENTEKVAMRLAQVNRKKRCGSFSLAHLAWASITFKFLTVSGIHSFIH